MDLNDDKKDYKIVLSKKMISQMEKLDKNVLYLVKNILYKLRLVGPLAGKIIDSKEHIYEMKLKHPPLRLYFKEMPDLREIYVFEFELKKSARKQNKTIWRIKNTRVRI